MDDQPKADTEETKGKSAGQRVGWVVAFVVAFFVAKEGKQWWFDNQAVAQAGENANKAMDDLRAKAVKEHPNQPAAYAVQNEALKQSSEKLAKESGDKQADTAAGQFIGFYMVNVRTRPDYCKALGVDISPYTNAFKQDHAKLYAKSRAIHARSPYTPDKIEAEMYAQLLPTFQKTIAEAMATMASQNKVTETEVCNVFAQNGAELAKEMLLSKINPALYKALSEAQ